MNLDIFNKRKYNFQLEKRIFSIGEKNMRIVSTTTLIIIVIAALGLTTCSNNSGEGPNTTSTPYTKVGTTKINGIEYDYVTFGLWPQTISSTDITINRSESKTVGAFTYCKGSDGEWYAELKENAYGNDYEYSNETTVAQSTANTYKWFKVEPIKWRVLTNNYNGKKLLLAEKILIAKPYYRDQNNRTINSVTIYANNYENSDIRTWLNGEFLNTAFSSEQKNYIKNVTIDNSVNSTLPDNYDSLTDSEKEKWNNDNGTNDYVCSNTSDKVFLLSNQEITKGSYGFSLFDNQDNARLRIPTDYAKASGAYQQNGGRWWLRSPRDGTTNYDLHDNCAHRARYINHAGRANHADDSNVNNTEVGVVPALCINN